MSRLQTLPNELTFNIITRLGIKDITDLSRTCTGFYNYCQSKEVSQYLLESEAHFSSDFSNSSNPGETSISAVRRIVKQQEALSEARPFSVAILGFSRFYIYSCKWLWYINGYDIRGLQLDLRVPGEAAHGLCSNTEIVINYHTLLKQTAFAQDGYQPGSFCLLHFQGSILSCLYRLSPKDDQGPSNYGSEDSNYEEREPVQEGWLIVLDVKARSILFEKFLNFTKNIFARHGLAKEKIPNKPPHTYLYYGFREHDHFEKRHRWTLSGFDLTENKSMGSFYYLQDINGFELGSTVCFEIVGGFFYAVTNQSNYRAQEIDWSSFYHCIRFPLDTPQREFLETSEERSMWRRQHSEGPVDDRWSSLSLIKDETSGQLIILECRKELAKGQRTAYKTKIVFPVKVEVNPESTPVPKPTIIKTKFKIGGGTPEDEEARRSELLALTQDRVALTLEDHNTPRFLPPQERLASNVHSEPADGTFTFSATSARSYNASASCFLDLVNDRPPHDLTVKQCFRLRACTRRPGLPPKDENGVIKFASDSSMQDTYIDSPISFWPPQLPAFGQQDDALRQLHELLNPPLYQGKVIGTFDDTSLVYSVGKENTPKALVFINFDASLKLPGLKRWDDFLNNKDQSMETLQDTHQLAKGKRHFSAVFREKNKVITISDEACGEHDTLPHRKQRKALPTLTQQPDPPGTIAAAIDFEKSGSQRSALFRKDRALYLSIGQGFEFSVPRSTY